MVSDCILPKLYPIEPLIQVSDIKSKIILYHSICWFDITEIKSTLHSTGSSLYYVGSYCSLFFLRTPTLPRVWPQTCNIYVPLIIFYTLISFDFNIKWVLILIYFISLLLTLNSLYRISYMPGIFPPRLPVQFTCHGDSRVPAWQYLQLWRNWIVGNHQSTYLFFFFFFFFFFLFFTARHYICS